jgi:hypothetical protein
MVSLCSCARLSEFLMENEAGIDFPVREVIQEVHFYSPGKNGHAEQSSVSSQL